ncbi:MAG: GEVED domain-containing protein [Flavobacteriaceae bacterium]|nr:GEVED domain-containing protein [Flavobacteriaceae bacterium]
MTTLDLDFNLLTTAAINQILIDLDAAGQSSGNLNLQGNPGTITVLGINAYNNLLAKGWNIVPPVIYDYGDAGNSFGIAQHIVGVRDIKLGVIVDSEVSSFFSANADGDDLNNFADEDAAVLADFDGIITSTDNFSMVVDYTNNYFSNGTIYAWIDFDGNGTFDADEYTSAPAPVGGANTATLTWSNLIANGVNIVAGTSSARLRITTDGLTGADAAGVASDGEVEDYGGIVISLDTDGDGIIDTADVDDDNDGILDTVEDNGVADRDTDGDGIPDRIELDADNDGCFDVIEAGFTDGDGDGLLGSAPVTVDSNGQVTSGTDGYTAPADLDANGTPDFQEAGAAATITTQPVDQNLIIGNVTFSTVAVADTYQWELSMDGGAVWTAIADGGDYSGATTAALVVTNSDVSKLLYQFRVIVSNIAFTCDPGTTSDSATFITPIDTDLDGIFDIVDVDDDNDGILDTVEDNGVVDRDTDGDGTPDRIELDADNDGCFDVIEAGFTDGDADGKLGSAPVTVDANGQVTSGTDGYTAPADLDANGTPDFQEVGLAATITTQPANQNFALGNTSFAVTASADTYQWQVSTDAGANWADLSNGGDYAGVTTATLTVTNSDLSKVNYLYRLIVSNSTYACDPTTASASAGYITPGDTDSDGVPDIVDVDDDNDGILDTVEDNGVVDRDTDGDGTPDRIELDADNDGCFDVVEAGFTDGDSDGKLGSAPVTVDANGQVTSGTDGYTAPADLDANGTPDFQEVGLAATITTQPTNQNFALGNTSFAVTASADTYQWQVSTDAGANWADLSNGGDYAGVTTATLTVTNSDLSKVNYLYRLIVSNSTYACDPTTASASAGYITPGDTDSDGVPDIVDVDDDNDGILDTVEDNGVVDRDTDGDGIPDRLELDADNDGCFDVVEAGFTDGDSDGKLGSAPVTVDANGQVTSGTDGYTAPADLDANGTPDFQEVGLAATITTQPANQNFIPNASATFTVAANADTYQWQVSPNGGAWIDLVNGGNYNGVATSSLTISNLTIGNINDRYRVIVNNRAYACDPTTTSGTAGYIQLTDTDGDGVPDLVDVDDDNDGILDTVEDNGVVDRDTDGDGVSDRLDLDSDNDGCSDVIEAGFTDTDGDGRLGNIAPPTVDATGKGY